MYDSDNQHAPQLTDTAGLEHLVHAAAHGPGRGSIDAGAAVLYLRVSTERQMHTAADIDEDGNSIATQREAALARAARLRAPVAREFVEPGQSAQTIAKRPVFQAMMRYIDEHPEVEYVVIYMRSRVFRNHIDAAISKRALLEKGVRLISAKEEFGEGYMADAMEAITDVMNEVQVRQSGEDIRNKMLHKAQNGGTVGKARLGYLNVRKDFGGRLVNTIDVDPERAPLISWAFESYASGEYTLLTLQAALEEQGLTSRPSPKRAAQIISTSQLSLILRDPYYTGVMPYKGSLYPGRHAPLITKETFLRVQDVLAERAKRGQRDRIHHHFLKGMLFCERCHQNGRKSRLVYTEINGNGGVYEYFLCTGRQQGLCDLGSLPVQEVEAAVAREFGSLALAADFVEQMTNDVDDALSDFQSLERAARARLLKQLKKLDQREERLIDLAADAELNGSKLKESLRKVILEKGVIEQELKRTESDIVRGAESLNAYLRLLAQPSRMYAQVNNSARRQLLEAFFSELYADNQSDAIRAFGKKRPAVEQLHQASKRMLAFQAPAKTEKGPGQLTGAITRLNSVDLFSSFFDALGLNKPSLVGLT
jgi:site-specific DNA recombinase